MLLDYCKFMLLLIYLFLFHFQNGSSSLNYYLVQLVRYIFSKCIRDSNFPLQPSQLPTAKGNCLWYCHRRENHRQQIFAVDHLFTIRYEPFSILLNKIFTFIQMFTLLRKHSSPDYVTWSINFPFILDINTLRWSDQYWQF